MNSTSSEAGQRRNGLSAAIIATWVVVCIAVALVGVNALRQIERQASNDAAADAERVSRLLLASFERTSDAIDGFLTNFINTLAPGSSREELHARMRELYLPSSILQITIVDSQGRAFANSLEESIDPIDLTDREHIRVHMEGRVEGLYISAPVLGRISKMWSLQFSRAIRDDAGRLTGIVVASYDLEDFISFYEGLMIGEQGVVALVGLDGIVRVRSGREVTYNQNVGATARFNQIVARRNGRLDGTASVDGIERVAYFTTSERYPFYTFVGFDQTYIGNRVARLQRPIIASLAALALVLTLAMAGALWAIRRDAANAARLHQTQRLEALGKLTGGIAHDFNNLLTIVMGNLDLLRRAEEDRRERHISNALMAAERGRTLTQQLLAFSRRQTLSPEVIDLNRLIMDMGGMLTHSLRSDISIDFALDPGIWPIKVDGDHLQIALINLTVNARDAMARGGSLRIETRNVSGPGGEEQVLLKVSDTGDGMPPEVAARAFEPFFTTKDIGKGTGLGLAQVHGFVHQSGGRIDIRSAPGEGTSVSILFPRSPAPFGREASREQDAVALPSLEGLEVLVVDDNPEIVALAASVLADQGCIVRQTDSAAGALSLLQNQASAIDVLVSDIVMPGEMDGIALARIVAESWPYIATVLMTGYSEKLEGGEKLEGELMLKPFSPGDLRNAVARARATAQARTAACETASPASS